MATRKRTAQKGEATERATAGTTGVTERERHAEASVARAGRREISASSTVAQLSLGFATIATATPARVASPSAPSKRGAKSGGSVRQKFGELRAALADGWEIVQPIFARPLWSVSDDSATAFNFVLRRERTTRLLTVPEGRTVERFIREQQLMVDYRR
ncbi:MAG: hypothetical protein ACXVDA_18700 [Ktedonobacterales bacterium]